MFHPIQLTSLGFHEISWLRLHRHNITSRLITIFIMALICTDWNAKNAFVGGSRLLKSMLTVPALCSVEGLFCDISLCGWEGVGPVLTVARSAVHEVEQISNITQYFQLGNNTQ